MDRQIDYAALERAELQARGLSWYQWFANALNSLFESRGVKGEDGRGAPASNITPETVRHGERGTWIRD